MQAMILAAGFGTRLLPYTRIRPKPLFPILNIPLLLLTVERLKDSGYTKIIINCHHLQEQIVEQFSAIPGVAIQQEQEILGTGGGLRKAVDSFEKGPVLVTNGDIYHTIDYRELYHTHLREGAEVTLAAHHFPRFNTMKVINDRLSGFSRPGEKDAIAFTGVHVINSTVLEGIEPGKKSCIIERFKELLSQDPDAVVLHRTDGEFWTDMGTPEDYLHLHGKLLLGEAPVWPQLVEKVQSPFLISDGVHTIGCGTPIVEDWACIGDARIGKNVRITRSVIWDGAVIPDNSVIEDSIVTG